MIYSKRNNCETNLANYKNSLYLHSPSASLMEVSPKKRLRGFKKASYDLINKDLMDSLENSSFKVNLAKALAIENKVI